MQETVGVFDGSPAAKAGIRTGDIIVSVDGKTTTGHDIDEVSGWVRGEAGSTVTGHVRSIVESKTSTSAAWTITIIPEEPKIPAALRPSPRVRSFAEDFH